MSDLTEREIFSLLEDSFAEAASLFLHIANHTRRGPSYQRLIVVCKNIDGACRQAGHWRENYHWFVLGNQVTDLIRRLGDNLRENLSLTAKARSKVLFLKAALKMQELQEKAKRAKDRPHGKIGQILPEQPVDTLRQRAVQVPKSAGGVFLPEGATLQ